VSSERAEKLIVEDTPDFDDVILTTAKQQLLRAGQLHDDTGHTATVCQTTAVGKHLAIVQWQAYVHQLSIDFPRPTHQHIIIVMWNKKAMLSQGNRAMLQMFFSV